MSRRKVEIYNATRPTDITVRGANLNQIRVEIRVIYPDQAQVEEIGEVLQQAVADTLLGGWNR